MNICVEGGIGSTINSQSANNKERFGLFGRLKILRLGIYSTITIEPHALRVEELDEKNYIGHLKKQPIIF